MEFSNLVLLTHPLYLYFAGLICVNIWPTFWFNYRFPFVHSPKFQGLSNYRLRADKQGGLLCCSLIGMRSGVKGEPYHWELLNRGVKKQDMWSALGCLWVSSDFIRIKMAEAIPPDNSQLVCVGELRCPKLSEKRKCKNHAAPLQFIFCIRVTPKQSFSSPAVRQFSVVTRCSKYDIFIL